MDTVVGRLMVGYPPLWRLFTCVVAAPVGTLLNSRLLSCSDSLLVEANYRQKKSLAFVGSLLAAAWAGAGLSL